MLWRMAADLRRERIGMMLIDIDASRGAARSSSAACATRSAGSRPIHGRQMTGGKGGKEGNPFPGPYSGTKELPVAVARTRAISCRIPLDRADPVSGDRQNRVRELRKLASHPKGAEQTGSRSFRNSSPTVLAMRLAYVDARPPNILMS